MNITNSIFMNRIMHLGSGLASIGFAALCVLAVIFAAITTGVAFLLVAALGLLIYGIPAYVWGFLSLIRDAVVKYPKWLIRAGLVLAFVGLVGVLLS